ncbi:MAG: peroxiredoxin family protein [Candidatus Polarisedimenticolia bacterium]
MQRLVVPFLVTLGALGAGASSASIGTGAPDVVKASFERRVGNIEYAVVEMSRRPEGIHLPDGASGDLWYGSIMRRVRGETLLDSAHYVPVLAEYFLGQPQRAWYDADLDGDLADEAPARLWNYPGIPGARAFLAGLRWTVREAAGEFPVDWTVRVVLEPMEDADHGPLHRLQMVHVMQGRVTLEGKSHRSFLFDGNGDGIYTRDPADGLFVDLDDDARLVVDEISAEFAPLSVPFQMGTRIYELQQIDLQGRSLSLRRLGRAEPLAPPKPGEPAPAFSFRDLSGREVRLADYRGRFVILFFHASWCGAAARHAEALQALHDRRDPAGPVILGVSFDTDRAALEAFRSRLGLTWPTSFSGRYPWEDPIGRKYQVRAASAAYLIDPQGRLDGAYHDMTALTTRLAELAPYPL